jgi:hypothetical protein
MARLRFVEIDGRRYSWKDVVAAYREQAKAAARPEQPALFDDLKVDHRPPGERTAAERYNEPNLFASLKP